MKKFVRICGKCVKLPRASSTGDINQSLISWIWERKFKIFQKFKLVIIVTCFLLLVIHVFQLQVSPGWCEAGWNSSSSPGKKVTVDFFHWIVKPGRRAVCPASIAESSSPWNNTAEMIREWGLLPIVLTHHVCLWYWSHAPYEDGHLHLGWAVCTDDGDDNGDDDEFYTIPLNIKNIKSYIS